MGEGGADRIRAELTDRLGADRVRWDAQALVDHSHDWWFLTLLRTKNGSYTDRPACVVAARAADDVVTVLRYAGERGLPVVPYGGGSGVCGGIRPSSNAIVIDLRAMDRILEINETALMARAEAGKMGDLFEEELQARGYSMGHWPQSVALSTVGGWIATRAAGQYSTRYGSIEDMLLGMQVVMADGRVVDIKATPRRSAGPDLRHIFLGSEGTLGIVTEATLKIFPLPESRKMSSYEFASFDDGLEAIRQVTRAGWKPPVVRLYDATEAERHFTKWVKDASLLILLSEGAAPLTQAEDAACAAICVEAGGVAVGEDPVTHWLAERNNVPGFERFIDQGLVLDTIEVAAGWDRIHDLYREVIAAVGSVKDLLMISGHSSHSYPQGTNIYFTFVARPADPSQAEAKYLECWRRTMEATLASGGTIAHHHGIGRLRAGWMAAEHGEGLSVLRAVKHALDPRGILNPGVLLPTDAASG